MLPELQRAFTTPKWSIFGDFRMSPHVVEEFAERIVEIRAILMIALEYLLYSLTLGHCDTL